MYVKRLIEFAEAHPELFPPLGFQKKKVDWIVFIDEKKLTFYESEKLELIVPVIARSGSGATPTLLVDKPDYVFGWAPSDKEQQRSHERHASYVKLLKRYAEATNDNDVHALLAALNGPIDIPKNMKLGDFIVFSNRDGDYLHEKDIVIEFWSRYIQPEPDEHSFIAPCMFCGVEAPVMERHSINFVVNRERTKLISANKNAYESHNNKFSYGAPTCYVCEQKYGQALEYLLQKNPKQSSGEHMFSIGDITYVYWLRGSASQVNVANAFISMQGTDLAEMKNQLNQVFSGQTEHADFTNFCLLVVSANKGRLIVREYMEESMGSIHNRILRFLDAQQIGRDRLYGVYALAGVIHQKPSTQMNIIDVQDWMNWIFKARPLPGRILTSLIKRIQAEGSMYPIHAAVVKSWMTSQNERRELTMTTDHTNKTTGYLLGRVFALLEKIQGEATNPKNTLGSRFFGSASTTPNAVMGLLLKNAQHHLDKIRSSNVGRAVNLDKKLRELLKDIRTFPATMQLAEQAEFALGYYHEKESLWTKEEEMTDVPTIK